MLATNDHPYLLIIQLPEAVDSTDCRTRVKTLVELHGGKLLANVAASEVECLEGATLPTSIMMAEFPEHKAFQNLWEDVKLQSALAEVKNHPKTLILAVAGLPYVGLPALLEIPTIASVKPPANRGPRAYMLIQGTSTDQVQMDRYRDIILPMIKEQGAYYTVFDIDGNIDALHGEWHHNIFAISRWPDLAAGHAFWDSDRYQNIAIPTRIGSGHFLVHFFTGVAG